MKTIESKEELFNYWYNMGWSWRRVLGHYAARHGLTKEDTTTLEHIIEFAEIETERRFRRRTDENQFDDSDCF
jgi:hypothetical protein